MTVPFGTYYFLKRWKNRLSRQARLQLPTSVSYPNPLKADSGPKQNLCEGQVKCRRAVQLGIASGRRIFHCSKDADRASPIEHR